MIKYYKGVIMEEKINRTIKVIREFDIKNTKQYFQLQKEKDLLSLWSLKYITNKKNFRDMIKLAKEFDYTYLKCK